jgi:hypothetical protein
MNRRFPLDFHTWLVVDVEGVLGAFALATMLGLREVPSIPAMLNRAEWVDILAKLRGMRAMSVEALGFPVVRQYCGCRAFVERAVEPRQPPHHHDTLVVVFCSGHTYKDTGGARVHEQCTIGRLVPKSEDD